MSFNHLANNRQSLLVAVVTLLFSFTVAHAQSTVAITPASIDAKVKRGSSYTQTFTLTNNSETRLRFKCSVSDMWYDENNKRTTGRSGTLQRSASLWTTFTPTEIVVEPHAAGTVKAMITIPPTAAGGYYTVPVFEAMPAEAVTAKATTGTTAMASIGIRFRGLMMLTTLEASEYNVEVMGGEISPPTASAELTMQLDVRNRSNTHVRVRGAFALLNEAGALVGRGSIAEKRYLPDQRSMLPAGWAGELPPGKYTAVVTLSYNRVGLEPATVDHELPLIVK